MRIICLFPWDGQPYFPTGLRAVYQEAVRERARRAGEEGEGAAAGARLTRMG
jgi:hypothetical protein